MDNSKRNIAFVVGSVVLLGIAAYRLTAVARVPSLVPDSFTTVVMCMDCKQESDITYDSAERPPHTCPACDARSAYDWMYCLDCNHRFIPELVIRSGDERPSPKPVYACYNCGCMSYTTFRPSDEFQHPVGDAKLPPWPPK
jgi:hypothetical protein